MIDVQEKEWWLKELRAAYGPADAGYWGCGHEELSEQDFVKTMVDLWGGSWQGLYRKLTEKGYKLVKS